MASRRSGSQFFGRVFSADWRCCPLRRDVPGQLPPVHTVGRERRLPNRARIRLRRPRTNPAPSPDADLLALPSAFRYQVVLRPVGPSRTRPPTLISGQYLDGAWRQTSRSGTPGVDQVDEELDRRA